MWLNCLSSVAQWKSISTPIWRSEVLNQEGDSKIFFNPLSWSLNKFFVYLIVASWLQVWTTCVILKSTLNKIGSYTSNSQALCQQTTTGSFGIVNIQANSTSWSPIHFFLVNIVQGGHDSSLWHVWFTSDQNKSILQTTLLIFISFMTTILGQLRYLPFAYSFQLTSPLSFLFNSTVVVLASFSVICMYSK